MNQLHKPVSIIFSAPLIAAYVTVIFSILSPIGLGSMNLLTSILLGILFLTILPVMTLYTKSKSFAGWDLFDRKKRNAPYVICITSYVIVSIIFWFFGNHIMFLISLSYVTVTTTCFLINLFWKISAHTAGMAGPVTALIYVFGFSLASLYLLLVPLAYSRYKLGSHDRTQLVAGALVAIFITYLTYFMLW